MSSTTSQAVAVRPAPKVRFFLLMIGAVYLALVGVWWSGLGAIHTDVRVGPSSTDPASGRRTTTVIVSNRAPTALKVRSIAIVSDERFQDVRTAGPTLAGASTTAVDMSYVVDCDAERPRSFARNGPTVVVVMETLLGLERRASANSAFVSGC